MLSETQQAATLTPLLVPIDIVKCECDEKQGVTEEQTLVLRQSVFEDLSPRGSDGLPAEDVLLSWEDQDEWHREVAATLYPPILENCHHSADIQTVPRQSNASAICLLENDNTSTLSAPHSALPLHLSIHHNEPSTSAHTPKLAEEEEKTPEEEQAREPNPKPSLTLTPTQDRRLKELVAQYGYNWAHIASLIPGTNRKQLRDRYINFHHINANPNPFTPEEDALILHLVKTLGRKFTAIAEQLPGRTPGMIKNRYYYKLKKLH